MGIYTVGRIRIESDIAFKELRELSFQMLPNEHSTAIISGITMDTGSENYALLKGKYVSVYYLTESGLQERLPIFCGRITNSILENVNGFTTITIHLSSGTSLLDQKKISRSFQDSGMTYAEIIDQVIETVENGNYVCNAGEGSCIGKPLIQYEETNWKFAKRLASHFHTVVYPEATVPYPWFWFGIPTLQKKASITNNKYTVGISKKFYDLGGTESGYDIHDFVYYEVSTREDYSMNTGIEFQGKNLQIGEKYAEFKKGELLFTYMLCSPALLTQKKYYNSHFTGMSLLGEILAAEKETVKLRLHIDESQDVSKAYSYQWTPDTGSVMYCMPKVGTTVSLYFSDENEQSARAVNCIRTNGGMSKEKTGQNVQGEVIKTDVVVHKQGAVKVNGSSNGMSDSSKRGLSSEHGKKMFLYPDSIGFSEEDAANVLSIMDDLGVVLESGKDIFIESKTKVTLTGKKVQMEVPTEITLARGGE